MSCFTSEACNKAKHCWEASKNSKPNANGLLRPLISSALRRSNSSDMSKEEQVSLVDH
ncbi:hypothetical protein EV13_0376 [Prochlorococcus sp. MIT 0702]|nr:hypothetical protein EV13_0376 [Prochlorococcus sp. MIT 0702]